MMQGQIIEGRGGLYTVRDAAGIDHVLRAKKKFRRQHMTPLVGDRVEMGGLLGSAPVMPVHDKSSEDFIARGGRIPAPLQSLKN